MALCVGPMDYKGVPGLYHAHYSTARTMRKRYFCKYSTALAPKPCNLNRLYMRLSWEHLMVM